MQSTFSAASLPGGATPMALNFPPCSPPLPGPFLSPFLLPFFPVLAAGGFALLFGGWLDVGVDAPPPPPPPPPPPSASPGSTYAVTRKSPLTPALHLSTAFLM